MKDKITRLINSGYKITIILSIIALIVALLGGTFFCINRSFDYLNPIILIIGTIVYILLVIKLYKFLKTLSEKKKKCLSVLLIVIQFILLLLSAFTISSIPKVDLVHILTEINSLNHTGSILNNIYFSVYPNNRFLLILLYNIQKLSPANSEVLFFLLSSLSITTTAIFTYKTINRVFDINKALLSLIIFVTSPIFYLYVSYYYTDILMLPFASILIYLIVRSKDEDSLKANIIYGLLIGIISIIGYKIRAVCLIILMAYIIYLLVSKKIIVATKKIIPIFASAFLAIICITKIENNLFKNIDRNKEFPPTHWIMMGVNNKNNGIYSQQDYELSFNAKNKEERKELNLSVIKARLKKFKWYEFVTFPAEKLYLVWGKGDYSYQKYLDLVGSYNKSYRYLLEDENIVINYILQINKLAILLLTIISLINIHKKKEKSILAIALFGAILFYLIWEVCPRYGLSFLPWLILLSSNSYEVVESYNDKHNKNSLNKFIFLLTVIALVIGFNTYTSSRTMETTIAKSITNKVEYLTLEKGISVEESLKLNNKFNKIRLDFKKNSGVNSEYKFELLDENKKAIYEKVFTSNDVDNDHIIFKLNKTYNRGNYIIRIIPIDKGDLDVMISYKEEFDFYPEGSLKVNNKEISGDIMFKITDEEERSIYTYWEYFFIVIVTIGLEIVTFSKEIDSKLKKCGDQYGKSI